MSTTNCTPMDVKLAHYASGAVSPGLGLLIATHIEQNPQNAEKVETYEAIGGSMLACGKSEDMGDGALESVLARIELDEPCAEHVNGREVDEGPLPASLMRALGTNYGDIRWQARLPGLSEHVLDGFSGERVSLLRARPGAWMPKHTHEGEETTLILTGAMEDGGVRYVAGDIVLNDETVDHQPRIVGSETCHCLVVMTGSMRFTGTLSRALNYLGE